MMCSLCLACHETVICKRLATQGMSAKLEKSIDFESDRHCVDGNGKIAAKSGHTVSFQLRIGR
jgi:hypothetical protein